MIYSLRGNLILKELGLAVVECGGVGYACVVSDVTYSRLKNIGEETFLYTHFSVREDNVSLFGFYSTEELNCFRLLTSVTGVGPKAAMSILSSSSPQKIALAAASGDSGAFTKTKGIGAKLAQRIVLELKDKIEKDSVALFQTDITFKPESGAVSEAVSALTVLGYTHAEAVKAVAGLDPALSSAEMIRQGLKKLSDR